MSNGKQFIVVLAFIAGIFIVGATQMKGRPPLTESLGETLVDRRGHEVASSELESKDHVLIYFSASWCGPCRRFTPQLVEFYNDWAEEKSFEVVFVSLDQSAGDMKKYMKDARMPWLAVPYNDYAAKSRLNSLYGARGIPHLVLVDRDGEVLSSSYEGGRYVGPQKVLGDFQRM